MMTNTGFDNPDSKLEVIPMWLYDLVEIQKDFNELYSIRLARNDINSMKKDLKEEENILFSILFDINQYFGYDPAPILKLPWNCFRLNKDYDTMRIGRYLIDPPWFLDRSTVRFELFKEMMVKFHEDVFLHKRAFRYTSGRVEDNIWELPCFIQENDLINKIRKELK